MEEGQVKKVSVLDLLQRPKVQIAVLMAIFVFQVLNTSSQKSPAFDEPFHFASGLLYVESGRIVRPPDHPPLARELSGLSLHMAGVKLPESSDVAAVLNGQGGDLEYPIGDSVLAQSGADRVLFWARLPFLFLGAIFIWGMYQFGRALVGETAGVCAAFLCTFDPIVLSNFGLVYTDASVALFVMLAVLALWHYVQRPTWWSILWCGLALGASLGAKYSAVVLLPVIPLLLLAAKLWPPQAVSAPVKIEAKRSFAKNYFVAFFSMCAIATAVLLYVFLWPRDPMFYVEAMHQVNLNHNPQYLYYLGGQYAKHFNSYYAEAWLLKEPLAIVVLTVIGAFVLARNTKVSKLACLFLLLPAGALFAGYSLLSDNLGVRYILPVLPFSLVAAAAGVVALWRGALWMRVTSVVLCVWLFAASAGVYPDHMNYFNESACLFSNPSRLGLAGGTNCGPDWLDDSNVDSGQGMKELRTWIDENAAGKRVYLGYFGTLPPSLYGLTLQSGDYATVLRGTDPGLYAVSAHIVARAHPGAGSNGAPWLLTAKPIAFVGHTYFIYRVP